MGLRGGDCSGSVLCGRQQFNSTCLAVTVDTHATFRTPFEHLALLGVRLFLHTEYVH